MHRCYRVVSTETLISEVYLWHGTHTTLLRELYDDLWSSRDIDLFVDSAERVEEILRFHAVGAVVFGIYGEHSL